MHTILAEALPENLIIGFLGAVIMLCLGIIRYLINRSWDNAEKKQKDLVAALKEISGSLEKLSDRLNELKDRVKDTEGNVAILQAHLKTAFKRIDEAKDEIRSLRE